VSEAGVNSVANAVITLKRTGGTDNTVTGKVTFADVTTSSADYFNFQGFLDNTFNPLPAGGVGANSNVQDVILLPDGKVLIGGFFQNYNFDASASDGIARLNSDGTLDKTFNYGAGKGANNAVMAMALQPDGKILIGGDFTGYNGDENAGDRVLRLNADGTLDTTFNYGAGKGASSTVLAVALQPDGKILIGGTFSSYNGDTNASNCLTRLNSDGTLDTSFNYGSEGVNTLGLETVVLQPDGKILVGGFITSYNGDTSAGNGIARINSDGTLDTSFNYGPTAGANGNVYAVTVAPDGKIMIGGNFTSFNGDANASDNVARLNADGTLDTSFNYGGAGTNGGVAGTNGRVDRIIYQPDGKIIIGGDFISYNNDFFVNRAVLRLHPNGTADTTFRYQKGGGAGIDGPGSSDVLALALQPDGKILIGGIFTNYGFVPGVGDGIARLQGDFFVTWAAGDATDKSIQFSLFDDTLDEAHETLALTVTPLTGGASAGAPSTATLTIVDNDVTISQVSGTGRFQETGTLTAKLTDNGAPLSGKTIIFSNGDIFNKLGEATTDANGVATASNVSFASILVAGTFPDSLRATFLGDADLAATSSTGPLTVILPAVQLSSTSYVASEAAGRVTITVVRTETLNAVSVRYQTDEPLALINCNVNTGEASPRCDYTAVGGTLNFAAGESSKTFTIPIINDVYVEGNETLHIALSNVTGAFLGSPSNAFVTITDDDTTQGAPNPINTRDFLVRQFYLDFLNREPDPPGLAAWLDRLNTCPRPGETIQNCDEIEIASAFFRSPEFFDRGYFLYRFYEGALVRQPQYIEFQNDLRRVTGFLTPEEVEQRKQQFVEEFVNRGEFHDLYDSFANGQPFVDAVLARAGSARPGVGAAAVVTANRQSVIDRLGSGQITRAQALRELMESPEVSQRFFNKAFVVVEYFGFLRRNPDAAYFNWINVLNTTGDYREMIRGFLQSAEYRFRFGT
jgi:uncharacterized delta-60 repeat protein